MKDIQQYTDQELIDELRNRYDCFVMAGRKITDVEGHKVQRNRHWDGDLDACIGLSHGIICAIEQDIWGLDQKNIL